MALVRAVLGITCEIDLPDDDEQGADVGFDDFTTATMTALAGADIARVRAGSWSLDDADTEPLL